MSASTLIFRLIAIAGGALSFVALAMQGFSLDLGAHLLSLIDGWDAALKAVLGWLIPPLLAMVGNICSWFGWNPHLQVQDHWTHIYTILQLYFLRDATNFRELRQQESAGAADAETLRGLRLSAVLSYAVGLPVALVSAMASGLVDPLSGEFRDQLQIAVYPIIGFVVYALAMSAGGAAWNRKPIARRLGQPDRGFGPFFADRVKLAAIRFAVGIVIVVACLHLAKGAPKPYLLAVCIAWIVLALEWLRRGWGQARKAAASRQCSLRETLMKEGNINLATNMLGMVGLAAILIGLDHFLSR